MMNWCGKVKKIMEEKNISQKDLSKKSGITESSVSRYLNSKNEPRMDVIINFAKALEVPVDYLLEEKKRNISNPYEYIANAIITARDGGELSPEEKNKLISLIIGTYNAK